MEMKDFKNSKDAHAYARRLTYDLGIRLGIVDFHLEEFDRGCLRFSKGARAKEIFFIFAPFNDSFVLSYQYCEDTVEIDSGEMQYQPNVTLEDLVDFINKMLCFRKFDEQVAIVKMDRKQFRDLLAQRVIDYLNDHLWDLEGEVIFTEKVEDEDLKNVPEELQDWTEEVENEVQDFIHKHFKI
ncbi:MAG: hypothetical protein FVQ80_11600 [Planctomycetes bacterium]|nr:hypothetical protein [Planctomycetota bacterium]